MQQCRGPPLPIQRQLVEWPYVFTVLAVWDNFERTISGEDSSHFMERVTLRLKLDSIYRTTPPSYEYQLRAVTCFYPAHYSIYIYQEGQWILCDDMLVERVAFFFFFHTFLVLTVRDRLGRGKKSSNPAFADTRSPTCSPTKGCRYKVRFRSCVTLCSKAVLWVIEGSVAWNVKNATNHSTIGLVTLCCLVLHHSSFFKIRKAHKDSPYTWQHLGKVWLNKSIVVGCFKTPKISTFQIFGPLSRSSTSLSNGCIHR
jgi:hypothetical protein